MKKTVLSRDALADAVGYSSLSEWSPSTSYSYKGAKGARDQAWNARFMELIPSEAASNSSNWIHDATHMRNQGLSPEEAAKRFTISWQKKNEGALQEAEYPAGNQSVYGCCPYCQEGMYCKYTGTVDCPRCGESLRPQDLIDASSVVFGEKLADEVGYSSAPLREVQDETIPHTLELGPQRFVIGMKVRSEAGPQWRYWNGDGWSAEGKDARRFSNRPSASPDLRKARWSTPAQESIRLGEEASTTITRVFKKFTSDSKMLRGGLHKVMLTGAIAAYMGSKSYTLINLEDLPPQELQKLAGFLQVKTESADLEEERQLEPYEPGIHAQGPNQYVISLRTTQSLANAKWMYWNGEKWVKDRADAKIYTSKARGSDGGLAFQAAKKAVWTLHPESRQEMGRITTELSKALGRQFNYLTVSGPWVVFQYTGNLKSGALVNRAVALLDKARIEYRSVSQSMEHPDQIHVEVPSLEESSGLNAYLKSPPLQEAGFYRFDVKKGQVYTLGMPLAIKAKDAIYTLDKGDKIKSLDGEHRFEIVAAKRVPVGAEGFLTNYNGYRPQDLVGYLFLGNQPVETVQESVSERISFSPEDWKLIARLEEATLEVAYLGLIKEPSGKLGVAITINGREYHYAPTAATPEAAIAFTQDDVEQLGKKFKKVLALSPGRALVWLKNNAVAYAGTKDNPLGDHNRGHLLPDPGKHLSRSKDYE